MALRQHCPGPMLLNARSFAVRSSRFVENQWPRFQLSILRPGQNLLLSKKLNSVTSHRVVCGRRQSLAAVRTRRISVTRAVLDGKPEEKKVNTMQESSTTSEGFCDQLQETPKQKHESEFNFDHPLGLTACLSLAYAGLALSLVPSHLHGPLGILSSMQGAVFRSNTAVARLITYLAVFLHILETLYARHLALKVDRSNVGRWAISTAFYGLFTLRHLIAKSNARKSD